MRDFDFTEEEADDELYQYIFDKLCNEGRPFELDYYDPAAHQQKTLRVRLIESELKDQQVLTEFHLMRWLFYLDTKEVREESHISVAQLLLEKMIKRRISEAGWRSSGASTWKWDA